MAIEVFESSAGASWPAQTTQASTPALRNRTGFGMATRHAYTGGNPTVIHVTNTNSSGAGSLAAALQTSGNRIVVFDTSGTIPHPVLFLNAGVLACVV